MMSLCKSENVGCETIRFRYWSARRCQTCLELINLKSVRERRSTVSEREWRPLTAETFSRDVVQRAERDWHTDSHWGSHIKTADDLHSTYLLVRLKSSGFFCELQLWKFADHCVTAFKAARRSSRSPSLCFVRCDLCCTNFLCCSFEICGSLRHRL